MSYKKIILLFGPTASGKSRLALDIAKKFNGEIVNADSMQIYKEIKVLSAKPEDKSIKHHLYGFVSVKKNFSVGLWYKLAAKKINEINKKDKIAIVVGGTGLYFKILIDGLSEIPEVPTIDMNLNPMVRFYMRNSYSRRYAEIFRGIPANDKQRLYRAISVYEHTGTPLWEWYEKKNKKKYFKSDEFTKIYLVIMRRNPQHSNVSSRAKYVWVIRTKNYTTHFRMFEPQTLNSIIKLYINTEVIRIKL